MNENRRICLKFDFLQIPQLTCRTGFIASIKSLYSMKCRLVVANISKTAWSSVLFVGKSEKKMFLIVYITHFQIYTLSCKLEFIPGFIINFDSYEYVTFHSQILPLTKTHRHPCLVFGRNQLFVTSLLLSSSDTLSSRLRNRRSLIPPTKTTTKIVSIIKKDDYFKDDS